MLLGTVFRFRSGGAHCTLAPVTCDVFVSCVVSVCVLRFLCMRGSVCV